MHPAFLLAVLCLSCTFPVFGSLLCRPVERAANSFLKRRGAFLNLLLFFKCLQKKGKVHPWSAITSLPASSGWVICNCNYMLQTDIVTWNLRILVPSRTPQNVVNGHYNFLNWMHPKKHQKSSKFILLQIKINGLSYNFSFQRNLLHSLNSLEKRMLPYLKNTICKKGVFLLCQDAHSIKPTVNSYGASFTMLMLAFFPEFICNYLFSPRTSRTEITRSYDKMTSCHIFNGTVQKDKTIFTSLKWPWEISIISKHNLHLSQTQFICAKRQLQIPMLDLISRKANVSSVL